VRWNVTTLLDFGASHEILFCRHLRLNSQFPILAPDALLPKANEIAMTKVHRPRRMRPLSAAAKSRLPQGVHSDRPLSDRSVVDLSELVPQLGSLFVRRTSEVGSQPVRHDRQRPRLQPCPLEARARPAYRLLRFRCRDARRWSRLAIRMFARIRTVSGKGKPCPLGIRGRTSAIP